MITCRELMQLVTDYFEDALTPGERLRFEQHVMICPPCRGYLAQMRKILHMSGRLAEDSIDPIAEKALLEAFRDWRRDEALE